jgi:sugar phosphate isomerase/epimerase
MILSRREWHRLVCAGFISGASTPSAQPDKGVLLGVQSYSFRDRSLDAALTAMQQLGLTSCELWQGHVEPRDVARGEMRRWRETVPLASFRDIKSKFDRARIAVSAYNISFKDDFSDTEIARGFEMAEALGTHTITASANIAVIQRVAPVAARRRVTIAVHNHSRIDPKEFATPDHFTSAMKTSPFIAVNLDIGHFTAANFDAVDFLRAHHDRIVSIHIKDRRRNDGPNVPFGEGDTPIGETLRLLRDERWTIPANIEYEYKGGDTVEEVRRCLAFCRQQLES